MSDKAVHTRCAQCRAPIRQVAKGRTRRTCGDACRKAAQRGREASWTWLEANAPPRVKLPTMDDMYAAEHGADAAPPSPDHSTVAGVTETIVAAMQLAAEFRRHGVAAVPQLGARCGAVAAALDAALAEHFGDVLKI